jgi:alanine racemase
MATSATYASATAEAVVDLAAIAHNTAVAAAHTDAALMAVVKADGFGHGMVSVARTALAAGATWLGVASRTEALQLRAAGVAAPVLTWLHGPDEDFEPVVEAGVDVSVASPVHLDAVASAAGRLGVPASVHLKIDTGLTRNGAAPYDWPDLVERAAKLEADGRLRVRGVWSHLATADEPGHPGVARQLADFEHAVALARSAGLEPELLHLANSAGIFAVPEAHFQLVRVGIALYGVEPVAGQRYGLRPAMTLRARVVNVKRVPAGTGVSYGHEYLTRTDTTVALVPLGYADGVPRRASNRAEVLLGGVRCPVAGRVAMDQFVVDVGDLPVRIGDEVVLFGGCPGMPTVDEWAAWADTNPHEVLTGIGPRVPRRYLPTGGQE